MKILIICYYYPPMNSIASLRPYGWAKYFSKVGHDVTVLTLDKKNFISEDNYKSDVKIISLTNIAALKKSVSKSVKSKEVDQKSLSCVRKNIFHKIRKRMGIFMTARMPDQLDFNFYRMYNKVKNKEWDLVISTSGPYFVHIVALLLKLKCKTKKWVVDYRDLWTQNHIYKGLFPFTILENILERKINNKCDLITTVSKGLKETIQEKYNKTNCEVLYNGFDYDDFEELPSKSYWNDEKIRYIYTGTIYEDFQDVNIVFDTLKLLKSSEEYSSLKNKFEIIFYGNCQEIIERKILEYDVFGIVSFGGYLSRLDSLWIQRDCSSLIFLNFYNPSSKGILTGKIFEYVASGNNILYVGKKSNIEIDEILESCPVSMILEDTYNLYCKIINDINHRGILHTKKEVNIEKKFDKSVLALKLLEFIVD